MRSGHDGAVSLLHHHHAAPLHALRGEGGAGVREGRHLQVRRQPGALSANIDNTHLVCLKTDTPLS